MKGKSSYTLHDLFSDLNMTFVSLQALGKLNPQTAFMRGKLKISGNIMLTQKLKSLMELNKSKL